MSPVQVILMVAGAASAAAWTASLITREHSWVDRAWSVLPVIYLWIFALAPDSDNPRLTLMAILVTAWGARLTFNFARKGGYRGVEDYRWPILRRWMSPGLFVVFNLVFIVLYQNALLVLITLPAQTVLEHPNTSLGVLDAVVAVIFLACLAGEASADRQQWDFQQWKKLQHAAGVDARPRFVVSGWWRYSRHPNFFFEQAQWWTLYLFAVIVSGEWLHWSATGAALLTALFAGSTMFTERITRSRYPEYAQRQATVSPWLPLPPRSPTDPRGRRASAGTSSSGRQQ
jgi:steroid 5-alpha reductase family enzyme